jgi:hypothetical protein
MEGMTEEQKNEFLRSFGGGTCGECAQPSVKGRYACKGQHTKMVVFPDGDDEWARFFQGCILNGAKYLSNGPGHFITVPSANDFESQIRAWVRNERETAQGKKKQHRSGSIGGQSATGFTPFNGAGFR